MVTTIPRPPRQGAFTIIESLIVLAILAVLTMVLIALYRYETNSPPKDKTPPASRSGADGDGMR